VSPVLALMLALFPRYVALPCFCLCGCRVLILRLWQGRFVVVGCLGHTSLWGMS